MKEVLEQLSLLTVAFKTLKERVDTIDSAQDFLIEEMYRDKDFNKSTEKEVECFLSGFGCTCDKHQPLPQKLIKSIEDILTDIYDIESINSTLNDELISNTYIVDINWNDDRLCKLTINVESLDK